MQVPIAAPVQQTAAFAAIFLAAIFTSVRMAKRTEVFPSSLTKELKGFAILTVILGHIGYALASDNHFLWPLSIMAGVGVNIFLFLSGYGLVASSEKALLAPKEFYRRRFVPILVPLWIVLVIIYAADALVLHKTYPLTQVIQSVFGIFTSAKMATDLNSPLWYLTFLFANYLAFPWVYRKSHPYRSAVLMGAGSYLLARALEPVIGDIIWLYVTHVAAFPLGMVGATLVAKLPKRPVGELIAPAPRTAACVTLAALVAFTAINSGVGGDFEQLVSVVTTLAVIVLFALLPFSATLFALIGTYSYEIYLFHWPLLYRYDFLYAHLPPALATALYVPVFLALGWLLHRLVARLMGSKTPRP